MEKLIFPDNPRDPILYHPAPANAGHEWENHAAPEWEVQAQELSPWAYSEAISFASFDAWERFGILHLSLPDIVHRPWKIEI